MNLYAYVKNNPSRYQDPWGEKPKYEDAKQEAKKRVIKKKVPGSDMEWRLLSSWPIEKVTVLSTEYGDWETHGPFCWMQKVTQQVSVSEGYAFLFQLIQTVKLRPIMPVKDKLVPDISNVKETELIVRSEIEEIWDAKPHVETRVSYFIQCEDVCMLPDGRYLSLPPKPRLLYTGVTLDVAYFPENFKLPISLGRKKSKDVSIRYF
ncbi:hypothetical protein ACFL5I_01065 [Planctomycetota bacterium]